MSTAAKIAYNYQKEILFNLLAQNVSLLAQSFL